MGCDVWSLSQFEQAGMRRMKKAKCSSWWWCRECSTTWRACNGESCCSFSILTILPSWCIGGKVWSSYCHRMYKDPSPLNSYFSPSLSLQSYGKLVHSAMLELALMVNSLTGSQKVSIFHSQRWLSVWISVCITNFNLWPYGSLRPRLCRVRMTHCWAWATFGTDAADVSKGVLLLLQYFLISRQEKSVTPAKAAVLREFKWHRGFSRIQVLS